MQKSALLSFLLLLLWVSLSSAQQPLKVGDTAPDFTVKILGGKTIKLSDQLKANQQPIVVIFSRANW